MSSQNRSFNSRISAVSETGVMKQMGPLQTVSLLKLIPIPPGEDDTSFHRNNTMLLSESKKSKPNPTVIQTLIKITLPF